jgi:hypothetical protein
MGVGTRIRGGNGPSVWKDDPGLGDVVTNHDAGGDRDVEVVMGAVLQAFGGDPWVRRSGTPYPWRSGWR